MVGINKKVLILKTSLVSGSEVERISPLLNDDPLIDDWSVDLEDCDKVLRIECYGLSETDIVEMLQHAGVKAEELL